MRDLELAGGRQSQKEHHPSCCGARARSVVMMEGRCTQHERSAGKSRGRRQRRVSVRWAVVDPSRFHQEDATGILQRRPIATVGLQARGRGRGQLPAIFTFSSVYGCRGRGQVTRAGRRRDGELPSARRLHSNSLHEVIRDGRGDKVRGIGEGADR